MMSEVEETNLILGGEEGKTSIEFMPAGDYIVIDPEFKEQTEGGIIIPESAQEQTQELFKKVVAIGPKITSYSIGDRVTIVHYANPTMITINKTKYLCFREHEIVGKIYKQVKP